MADAWLTMGVILAATWPVLVAYIFSSRVTPGYVVDSLQQGLDKGEFDDILQSVLGRLQDQAVILVANGVHTYLANAQKEAGKKLKKVEDEVQAELFDVDPVTALLSEVVPPKYRKFLTKPGAAKKITGEGQESANPFNY